MLAWIPLFPLLGFMVNGILHWWTRCREKSDHDHHASSVLPGVIGTLAVFASFIVGVLVFKSLHPEEGSAVIEEHLFSWISTGAFHLDMTLRLDALNALFVLVITGVGTLIHIYSIGYMGHDANPAKFFAYLNLFCFSMLMLVMGGSLPVLFFGWEGVGLCSYLLIGFWYEDIEKASAGKKAFIVNRVGDLGFLLGMFVIYWKFGTVDFVELKTVLTQSPPTEVLASLIGLLLFVGCAGKSAQIPLYIWLPDAMAGPTPVSALIHAATMVTSGVYLMARMSFLYVDATTALSIIAWVGAITALFAATMAVAQRDIKKVLAYSTVSQLGYMFLGCGVGAYGAGVFHVITHAFFKALLFLGAGSVIFGMHHEQDMLKMGGLRTKMPKTFLVFTLGWLAICGVPPFSGFFSKDEILWSAFSSSHGSVYLWAIGMLTAVMTAFYMTRMYSLTFLGKHRGDPSHKTPAVHESPYVMILPLAVLAVLSAVGGWIGIPHISWIHHWLGGIIPEGSLRAGVEESMEWPLMAVSVIGAALGIFGAFRIYSRPGLAEKLKERWSGLHKLLENKWYIDELYGFIFVRPIGRLSELLFTACDVRLIDRSVLSFGRISLWAGQTLRVFQNGTVQVYAVIGLFGLLLTLGYLIIGTV